MRFQNAVCSEMLHDFVSTLYWHLHHTHTHTHRLQAHIHKRIADDYRVAVATTTTTMLHRRTDWRKEIIFINSIKSVIISIILVWRLVTHLSHATTKECNLNLCTAQQKKHEREKKRTHKHTNVKRMQEKTREREREKKNHATHNVTRSSLKLSEKRI